MESEIPFYTIGFPSSRQSLCGYCNRTYNDSIVFDGRVHHHDDLLEDDPGILAAREKYNPERKTMPNREIPEVLKEFISTLNNEQFSEIIDWADSNPLAIDDLIKEMAEAAEENCKNRG